MRMIWRRRRILPQSPTMMKNVRLRSSLGPRGRDSAIKSLRKTLPVAGKLLGHCYLHHVAVILKIKLQRFFIMRLKNSLVQAEKLEGSWCTRPPRRGPAVPSVQSLGRESKGFLT